MNIVKSGKYLFCVFLSVVMLVAFVPIAENVAYADDVPEWKKAMNGESSSFWNDEWESYGSFNTGSCASRHKYLDENTIYEEIYGVGECYYPCVVPKEGQKLIVYVGGEFTSIGSNFKNLRESSLVKVILTDSITKINKEAFAGCKVLSSINMPKNLLRIEKNAFQECVSLTNINFSSKLQYIDDYAFWDCSGIKSITTPSSIKKVGDAFGGCDGLTSVSFYGDNAVIDDCFDSSNNIKELTVGKGIKSISFTCDFKKLKTVTFNTNSMKKKKQYLFTSDDIAAKKVIYTGNGSIKDENFIWSLPKCKTVIITNGVKKIGKYAFGSWKNLREVVIPSSIKCIGEGAFCSCKKLKNLTIGSGVVKLGKWVADGSNKLKTITIKSKKLTKKSVKNCLVGSKVKTIKVKIGSKKINKKYVKKYKKIFTKKNCGRDVKVK